MRVTPGAFRTSTKGWLQEEGATQQQALQLLDALYAGLIEGTRYFGKQNIMDTPTEEVPSGLPVHRDVVVAAVDTPRCGCLVDTLEVIRGKRPRGRMAGQNTEVTFALAQKIRLGDTPTNNEWAKAAAQGIQDYCKQRGW
jgi:hypothetical protein